MKLDRQSIKLAVVAWFLLCSSLLLVSGWVELHDDDMFELSLELLLEICVASVILLLVFAVFLLEGRVEGISNERSMNGSCLCDLKPHSRQFTSFCKIPPKMFPIMESLEFLEFDFDRTRLKLLIPELFFVSPACGQFSRHSLSIRSNTYLRNSCASCC